MNGNFLKCNSFTHVFDEFHKDRKPEVYLWKLSELATQVFFE